MFILVLWCAAIHHTRLWLSHYLMIVRHRDWSLVGSLSPHTAAFRCLTSGPSCGWQFMLHQTQGFPKPSGRICQGRSVTPQAIFRVQAIPTLLWDLGPHLALFSSGFQGPSASRCSVLALLPV